MRSNRDRVIAGAPDRRSNARATSKKLVDIRHLLIESVEHVRQPPVCGKGRGFIAGTAALGRCIAKFDGEVGAQEHAPCAPLGDFDEQTTGNTAGEELAGAGHAHAQQLGYRSGREQGPVMEERRERG